MILFINNNYKITKLIKVRKILEIFPQKNNIEANRAKSKGLKLTLELSRALSMLSIKAA